MTDWAIEVKGLVKRFEDMVAVNGINLAIRRGECVGLLGPNGAGKTTTVEILEGLQEATEGEVRILGQTWRENAESIRAQIGVALQETRLIDILTVQETVELFASFYKKGLSADEAIGLVRLEEKRRAQVRKLSGGQRQRLVLATALVADPQILFLDEPTTGLDPQSRRALWDIIETLKKKGRTVLLTTHYMEEAEVLCDRVLIVDHGKIIAEGSPTQLITQFGGEQVVEFETKPALDAQIFDAVPGRVASKPRGQGHSLQVRELHRAVPAVLETVGAQKANLVHLSTRNPSLDDVFLNLTGRSLREGDRA